MKMTVSGTLRRVVSQKVTDFSEVITASIVKAVRKPLCEKACLEVGAIRTMSVVFIGYLPP
jgi:hypothetical protein